MGFRVQLYVGMAVIALIATLVQIGLGYGQFRRGLDAERSAALEGMAATMASAVELDGPRPRFNPDRFAWRNEWANGRLRVSRDGEPGFVIGGRFEDVSEPTWQQTRLPLTDGYVLEAALPNRDERLALGQYLRTNALIFPVTLACSLLLAWLLLRVLMRPVRQLTLAARTLERDRYPDALPLPPGRDEITELTGAFNQLTQTVKHLIERERSFTRYASHELRNPLAAARAQLEVLEMGLLPQERVLPNLKTSVERMEDVLGGLLTLTRSTQLHPEPIVLNTLAKSVLDALPELERHRVQLELPSESLVAVGQRELIVQAVVNLVQNALKYSGDLVTLTAKSVRQGVAIVVRDRGAGVPEEALARLTEPFYRINQHQAGLGLGLALVEHITTTHNGQLVIRNAHPGLEAMITLPQSHDEVAHAST